VADDDIDFAYIKATEGGDFVDERFEQNWEGAGASGLDRGAYHFFTLCRPGDEQADNFLHTVPSDPDALPPVVDLELSGNCADRPDQDWIEHELGTFVDRVESASGQTVVLYVSADFDARYHVKALLDRPVWHQQILLRPDGDGWWMWQVQARAAIDGIPGGTDLNIMRAQQPER
jgi:lysozyme